VNHAQVVACAASRYEFELWSGSVASVASEALSGGQGRLLALARAAGLWRAPPLGALHQMTVRAPDGRVRSFRFGTATADVPAQARLFRPAACAHDIDAQVSSIGLDLPGRDCSL
jgi:hypothetical protein